MSKSLRSFLLLSIAISATSAGCATEAGGAEEDVGVAVEAASKDDSNKKVEICHKGQTLSIAQPAISAHLGHGDTLGACKSACSPDVCDDGDLCTSDTCLPDGSCDHRPVSCDDGNPCTLDTCNPDLGCQYPPANGVACSDGNDCTGPDSCNAGRCTGSAIAGCCTSDTACSDGNGCTTDRCSNRACTNTAVNCSVADRCMAGFCNPATGACGATPVSCDDSNPCTDDSCDATVGCKTTPAADGSSCEPPACSGAACDGWICKSSQCVAAVQFGPDNNFTLGFPASSGDPVSLSLNRTGLNQLIGTAEQKALAIRQVSLSQPIGNGISALKLACGNGWQFDQADPHYNCDQTALGQTFVGPDGTWRSSAEFALVRVLTMTPANIVVDGTSLEALKGLADSLGIGGGFSQIIADTFGISRTRELLPAAQVQSSLVTRFVASHPAAPSGALFITLYDALNNLTPWATTYGPISGGHPGVVAPGSPVSAALFGPAFAVDVHGTSNLRSFQGLDLSATAAGAMQRLQAPSFDPTAVVEWDLSVVGVSDVLAGAQPQLMMKLFENTGFIRTCDSTAFSNCRSNTPTTPLATFVWSTPTWQLENVLAFAGNSTYAARSGYQASYLLGEMTVQVGFNGEPAGWSQWDTLFGIGSPPMDQYLWESLSETTQVALHRIHTDTGTAFLAEGQANVRLPITLDVHLTASQLGTALRPSLQAHTSGLDQRAVGDYAASNADLDFFAAYGGDGLAYLAFVSADDPRPVAAYPYAKPGFFADANLATEVSVPQVLRAGESSHKAVRLDPGVARTLYMMDAVGGLYRITATLNAASTAVAVAVAKAL